MKEEIDKLKIPVVRYDLDNSELVTRYKIITKKLFHEISIISTEMLNQKKLKDIENAEELVACFNELIIHQTLLNDKPTEYHTAGGFAINSLHPAQPNIDKYKNSLYKTLWDKLLPVDDTAFEAFMKESLDTLKTTENMILSMITTNMKLIHYDIEEGRRFDLTNDKKNRKAIQQAKALVDQLDNEIMTVQKDGSVLMDYGKYGLGKVYISKEMYNDPVFHKLMKPSRFLVRLWNYDVILVTHGTMEIINDKPTWIINPLTIDGKQYTVLDDVIRVLKKNGIRQILAISCNSKGLIPDKTLYDHVDYADEEVLFETVQSYPIKYRGNRKKLLQDLIRFLEYRADLMNQIKSYILTEIDNCQSLMVGNSFKYIKVSVVDNEYVARIYKDTSESIISRRMMYNDAINGLIGIYRNFLLNYMMLLKSLLKGPNQGKYTWKVLPENVIFNRFVGINSYDYTGNYSYNSLQECILDAIRYTGNTATLDNIVVEGAEINEFEDFLTIPQDKIYTQDEED